jgi:hypothetical protein
VHHYSQNPLELPKQMSPMATGPFIRSYPAPGAQVMSVTYKAGVYAYCIFCSLFVHCCCHLCVCRRYVRARTEGQLVDFDACGFDSYKFSSGALSPSIKARDFDGRYLIH